MLQKKHLIFLLISFLLVFSFINEYTSFKLDLEKEQQQSYTNTKEIYQTIIKLQNDSLKSVALLIANDTEIIKAYKQNNPKAIKEQLNKYWKLGQNKKLVYELHFFKPPAESFVNFSNFKSIGHDVSDVRTDIEWVTSSFQESRHIMMCKTFAGLRGTYPIVDEETNTTLGGLSLGKKIDWLPETIKSMTSNDTFLIYHHDATKTLKPKYYERFMKDKIKFNDLILADKTIELSTDNFNKIDFNKDIQNIVIDDTHYSLNIYRIHDFEKNLLAYIGVLNNLEGFYHSFYLKTLKSLFLLLLTGLFVYIILSIRITNILDEIKVILKLTNDIKDEKYETLPSIKDLEFTTHEKNALLHLEYNVIKMGQTVNQRTKQLQSILNMQSNLVITTNGKKIFFANKAFFNFFGYKNLEGFKQEHDENFCNVFLQNNKSYYLKDDTQECNWIDGILNVPKKDRTVSMQTKNHTVYYFSVSIDQLDTQNYIVSFTDISHKVAEFIELEEKTLHDTLTGAYNREFFEQNYTRVLKEYHSSDTQLAIALLDIDHFKLINDTYGHNVGDDVLVQLVETLKRYSREDDILIRWGGEEFVMILKVRSFQDLQKALEHLRNVIEIEEFAMVEDITCSIGGTVYIDNEDIYTTIKRADNALYEAKESGRNRVILKTDETRS